MPFSAICRFCQKKFRTGTALTKHFNLCHDQESDLGTVRFKDSFGKPCEEPKAIALEGEEREDYLDWMSVLVERVNMTLVPDHPGKWCHVDCFQVPEKYFCHILHRLGLPVLHSARDTQHKRQPIFKRNTRRLSYRTFDEEKFREILEEQDSVAFRPGALFCNDEEVPDISEMDADEALMLAKQRAKMPAARPTSRSLIEIGLGEGRRTREVEFIWWPSLYSHSRYGKLTIRFFIRKASV